MKTPALLALLALLAALTLARPARAAEPTPAEVLTLLPPARAVDLLLGDASPDGRFALGIARTLLAVENLGRGLYDLGPRRDTFVANLPFFRLPVPDNPDPKLVQIEDVANLLQKFLDDLAAARETLEKVDGEVALTLPLSQIALDFDGDGKTGDGERLGDVLFKLRLLNIRPAPGSTFLVVDFDRADVEWLLAYNHLLSGLGELALAHDAGRAFRYGGHLFFKRADTPYPFLEGQGGFNLQFASIADLAAFVHVLDLPVRSPRRLEAARQHFLAAVAGSRRQFDLAARETDAGREWLPNPKQEAALPGMVVTQETLDAWTGFLDDAEGALKGERLIPFWRASDGRGVNLRRVLQDPRDFDAVLWLQGTAAAPYLEADKPLITADSFQRMQRATGGNFFTFAAWFN